MDAQTCDWQTAYGLPWTETCGAQKASDQPYCAEHMEDLIDMYDGRTAGERWRRTADGYAQG